MIKITGSVHSQQSGLTLLELIVAILVLSFAMAGLSAVYPLFQSLDDVEEVDRFALKAQGCAEIILACYRVSGADALGTCTGNLNQTVNDIDGFLDSCDIDDGTETGDELDIYRYCGGSVDANDRSNVACKGEDEYTVFKIGSDAESFELGPIYFGVPSDLSPSGN
ncbi:prepilin-type N-terminal cleavage/methylation domain-containing protein [Halorhodospira sp. 9622]|uniref:type IV pilus modification PilV family protein n=1 Tax=Halorhodospira sp. 9622 TaxID=2899136 RepID=UPI001EE82B3E|nr:type II secretion system protein [Halorhodospira sp. 9622]MCG5538673.1 type II secretion system GspH family protein [Halorhodospira sp. 9622]